MDVTKKKRHYIFSLSLIKLIGFYHILNTDSGYNVYRIVAAFFGSYMVVLSTLVLSAEYYLMRDDIGFCICLGYTINFSFSAWKIFTILHCSKDIWKCLDFTGPVFTSHRRHGDTKTLKSWRNWTATFINILIVLGFIEVVILAVSPFVFDDVIFPTRQLDGSYRMYRLNVYNLFQALPTETYNDHFYVFYFIEIAVATCFVYFSIIFDILIIVLSFAFSCQLETISNTLQSFGYVENPRGPDNSSANVGVESGKKSNSSDNLITIITDHENVINHLYEFYSVFRTVLLTQIFVSSSSYVFIWFIAAMSIVGGDTGHNILTVKCMCIFPLLTFQLLMPCHLFTDINEKKDSIVSALYCSNWTDMDLKHKKLILCAMKTINANQLKLKFTSTKIVNLELFTNTIRLSYSLFSMLVNNVGKGPSKMK